MGGQKLGDPVYEFVKDITGYCFPPCGQVRNRAFILWKEGLKLDARQRWGKEGEELVGGMASLTRSLLGEDRLAGGWDCSG